MSDASKVLKCRFCNWTTAKAFTAKDGKFRGVDAAHQRLIDHVFLCHPEEYDRVQESLPVREQA